MKAIAALMFVLSIACTQTEEGAMNPDLMLATIERVGQDVQVDGNAVNFTFQDQPMVLVFDTENDRMRVVSPIVEVKDVQEGDLMKAMEANYHSALDARYAVSNGVVWSAFIHPLSDLSLDLLVSGISQVAVARITFGDQFTSGELVFGGANAE